MCRLRTSRPCSPEKHEEQPLEPRAGVWLVCHRPSWVAGSDSPWEGTAQTGTQGLDDGGLSLNGPPSGVTKDHVVLTHPQLVNQTPCCLGSPRKSQEVHPMAKAVPSEEVHWAGVRVQVRVAAKPFPTEVAL